MYKQIKPLQQQGKMRVTPEQNVVLQFTLLELGHEWMWHEGSKHLDKPFIIWDEDYYLGYLDNDQEHYFNISNEPLHIFTDYFTPKPLK